MEKIHVTIRGESMWPTFVDGQEIIATKYHSQEIKVGQIVIFNHPCLLYTSPSPRDLSTSRMPSSA